MAKYRKKPVIVEAFQLVYQPGKKAGDSNGHLHWPDWFREAFFKSEGENGRVYLHANGLFVIWTLEGIMEISSGDFVIKGVEDEIYPCKPNIFHATYDPV